jgi:Short C-terminal domain
VFALGEGKSKVVVGGKREQKGSPFGGGGQVFDWGEKGKITRKLLAQLDRVVPETPEPTVSSTASATASAAEELQRLADLRAQGVLTEDEFAAAKAKLLTS